MMFASGRSVSAPSSESASPICCSGFRYSEKLAMIRPAREMSRVSIVTPALAAYAEMMGKNEYVARRGASSV